MTEPATALPRPRLLTPDEAAAYLAISVRSLRRFENAGEIAAVRLSGQTIRYDQAELDRFVEERKSRPAPRTGGGATRAEDGRYAKRPAGMAHWMADK